MSTRYLYKCSEWRCTRSTPRQDTCAVYSDAIILFSRDSLHTLLLCTSDIMLYIYIQNIHMYVHALSLYICVFKIRAKQWSRQSMYVLTIHKTIKDIMD
jgi:hypothetical protein